MEIVCLVYAVHYLRQHQQDFGAYIVFEMQSNRVAGALVSVRAVQCAIARLRPDVSINYKDGPVAGIH